MKDEYPDYHDLVEVPAPNKFNDYYKVNKFYPWHYKKLMLLGDAVFSFGPEAGFGLNLAL